MSDRSADIHTASILIAQAEHEAPATGHEVPTATHAQTATAPHGGESEPGGAGEHHVGPWVFFGYSMIVLVATILLVLTLTRRMRLVPHGKQNFAEIVVEMLYGIPEQVMGPRGRAYAPFLGTFFIYIFLMNLSGLIPFFKPGTASLSVTLGLGITAFIAVQYFGFKTHGAGYIKHFMGPVLWLSWLILPLELISELIRPMSLSIRLYGNIFGEEQIVSALANNIPVIGPLAAVLILPLQLLTVVLQALVFTLLVTVYIALATEKHEEHHVTEEVAGMPAPALEH